MQIVVITVIMINNKIESMHMYGDTCLSNGPWNGTDEKRWSLA